MYSETDFRPLANFIAGNARDRFPAAPILLPGDLAWRLPGTDPGKHLRIYRQDGQIVGFAWFEPLTGFEFDTKVGLAATGELTDRIFAWVESLRMTLPAAFPRFVLINDMAAWRREIESPQAADADTGHHLTTIAMESDRERVRLLRAHGYEPTEHHAPVYIRDLSIAPPAPSPPAGWRLRSVTDGDEIERVAVHRAAWTGSSFDTHRYQEIRSRPVYDQQFDLVLEKAGTFGAYCICWADPISGIGHFEPVGARESLRGRGAARAVVLEGLRRLHEAGMKIARVSTPGFNTPAQALYESCGFRRVDTERTYIRQVG